MRRHPRRRGRGQLRCLSDRALATRRRRKPPTDGTARMAPPIVFNLSNEYDTERLGAALAAALPPGTVVGLIGTLGAGKTRLVQAAAKAVGVPAGTVTSPTFVLVNEYRGGRLPI